MTLLVNIIPTSQVLNRLMKRDTKIRKKLLTFGKCISVFCTSPRYEPLCEQSRILCTMYLVQNEFRGMNKKS